MATMLSEETKGSSGKENKFEKETNLLGVRPKLWSCFRRSQL